MSASRANKLDLLVLALLGVVVCTYVFTDAAQSLNWQPVAIAGALYLAGRGANLL